MRETGEGPSSGKERRGGEEWERKCACRPHNPGRTHADYRDRNLLLVAKWLLTDAMSALSYRSVPTHPHPLRSDQQVKPEPLATVADSTNGCRSPPAPQRTSRHRSFNRESAGGGE